MALAEASNFSNVFKSSRVRGATVTRWQLLAMVMAVRHLNYYLCGKTVTVRTDHTALR